MSAEFNTKCTETMRYWYQDWDFEHNFLTEFNNLKGQVLTQNRTIDALKEEISRLKNGDEKGRLMEENDRLKRAWHEHELVMMDEPEFFASRAKNEPHPGGWIIVEDDSMPAVDFPGTEVQQTITRAAHAGIEPKVKIKGVETWNEILPTLLPHYVIVERAQPVLHGPIVPRFKEHLTRHLQEWCYRIADGAELYRSVLRPYGWGTVKNEVWGAKVGEKPDFQGYSGDASQSFEQMFDRIVHVNVEAIREIVAPILTEVQTFIGQTVVSSNGAWGTSDKIFEGAGIQVTIDIGSKLWFIECPDAAFGVDLVFTGQGDRIVLGPGTKWRSYSIEPTIMHVHHFIDKSWIVQKGFQPKDLPVKVFYSLIAWAIGEQSEIDHDLAGAKVVLDRLGTYATHPEAWELNNLAKEALKPWVLLVHKLEKIEQLEQTSDQGEGRKQGKRKDRDEEGGKSNKKSRTAGRIAMSISDSEDNQ